MTDGITEAINGYLALDEGTRNPALQALRDLAYRHKCTGRRATAEGLKAVIAVLEAIEDAAITESAREAHTCKGARLCATDPNECVREVIAALHSKSETLLRLSSSLEALIEG